MKNNHFLPFIAGACLLIFAQVLQGQCTYSHILHLSGTQQVDCTSVTVETDGLITFPLYSCGVGPHFLSGVAPGSSYTFTFSPAITRVRINLTGINNDQSGTEEVAVTINGSFYPITDPGVPNNCIGPAIITPTGTIGAPPGGLGGWNDIIITENISTLNIENIVLSGGPAGVYLGVFVCCNPCLTDAGNMAGGPLNLCPGSTANLPPSNQVVLDNDDLLRYILYSNPDDIEGSIIATSTSPIFPFDPATMQEGVTYYIAAIAGNGLNGNVDFDDPCFDMSNAVPVIWHPLSVVFTVDNPDVCAGACTTVTASFTGTAPFTLSYATPAGPVTKVFQSNTGTFQVCTAANAPSGSLVIQATALTDAWCSCE